MLIKSTEIRISDEEIVEIQHPFVSSENEICVSDDHVSGSSLAKQSNPILIESDSEDGFESDAVLSECEEGGEYEQWEDRQLRAYRRTSFQEEKLD